MMLRARMRHLLGQLVFQDWIPWLWIGGAGLFLLVLLLWPKLGRRDASARRCDGYSPASLAQERAVERDVRALAHELSEMVRRAGAQLDAKSNRLEQLIAEADERIAHLNRATADDDVNRDRDLAAPPDDEEQSEPGNPLSLPGNPSPQHAQIYALQDQGLSPHQIAERLSRPTGEIELILALRPRGRAAS